MTLIEALNENASPFVDLRKWIDEATVRQAVTAASRLSGVEMGVIEWREFEKGDGP